MTLLQGAPGDPFLLYAVALEHKNSGQWATSVDYLQRTIAADAGYCYAYYQLGEVLEQAGDVAGAATAYRTGIAQARAKGDAKALSELQQALDIIEP
jgi:tetratricopeptide (TPR) repeat protein